MIFAPWGGLGRRPAGNDPCTRHGGREGLRHGESEREPAMGLVNGAAVPLEWDLPLEADAQLEETRSLAAECALACQRGVRFVRPGLRPAAIARAGITTLVPDPVEARAPDRAALLSVCIRVVDSFEPRLE